MSNQTNALVSFIQFGLVCESDQTNLCAQLFLMLDHGFVIVMSMEPMQLKFICFPKKENQNHP